MGNASKIILIVLAVLVVLGLGSVLMGSDTHTSTESDAEPTIHDYKLHYDNVKPITSVIELSKIESKSSTYAFFEATSGAYAEPAYSRSVSENVLIEIDISKMKLANDSLIDDSADKDSKEGNVYNTSHLKKDLKKLIKNNKHPASLQLYDKEYNVASLDNLKVSLKGDVLTVKGSYSNTSEYYTEYERSNYLTTKFNGDDFALNNDFDNVKTAVLSISGSIDDSDSNRTVDILIGTGNMKVSSSLSTDFKSTYDK